MSQNRRQDKNLRIGGPGGQNLSRICTSSLPLLGPPQLPRGIEIRCLSFDFVFLYLSLFMPSWAGPIADFPWQNTRRADPSVV